MSQRTMTSRSPFARSARSCFENGERLLDDIRMLEFEKPPATAFMLAVVAQEEFAKAFLLHLVGKGIIPWNSYIYRATRDHACKQLLGLVLDYLSPDTDEFLERIDKRLKGEIPAGLPATVADAIDIFRHEKVGRWRSSWLWAEDPIYDPVAKRIGEGQLDRAKQDALYVRLSKTGSVVSLPSRMLAERASGAIDRADRMRSFVGPLVDGGDPPALDYEEVQAAFSAVFADLEPDPSVLKNIEEVEQNDQ